MNSFIPEELFKLISPHISPNFCERPPKTKNSIFLTFFHLALVADTTNNANSKTELTSDDRKQVIALVVESAFREGGAHRSACCALARVAKKKVATRSAQI